MKNVINQLRAELAHYGFTDSRKIISDKELKKIILLGLPKYNIYGVFCDVASGFTLDESIEANKGATQ